MRGLKIIAMPAGSGFGNAACEYVCALADLGVPVSWHPLENSGDRQLDRDAQLARAPHALGESLARAYRADIHYDTVLMIRPAVHGFREQLHAEPGVRLFAYTTWELDRLPPGWTALLNAFEGVIVPSHFSRTVFHRAGVDAVSVVPHIARSIDTTRTPLQIDAIADDDFVFYTLGNWDSRKAIDATVHAYLNTFSADEPVSLVVKTSALDLADNTTATWLRLAEILARVDSPPRVHLINTRLTPAEVDALHRRGDCFVSLTHAEGWGLGAFDALLHANPVLMPHGTGQRDYLGDDYPLAIRSEPVPATGQDLHPVFRQVEGGRWLQADEGHAGELMRAVYRNPSAFSSLTAARSVHLHQSFGADTVARQLAAVLGWRP